MKTLFYSKLTGIIIFLIFFGFYFKRFNQIIFENNVSCLTSYDGFGYYSYLPATFIHKDLSFKKWPEELQNKYCGNSALYQFHTVPNNNRINIYHMGQCFVEFPSFLIGHLIAYIFNEPRDGMSKPYHISFLLNALVFIGLGIVFVRKLLLMYFDDKITSILIFTLYLGTNVLVNFEVEPSLTHLYLFTINTAFVYHAICFQRNTKIKHLLFSALLFGLTTAIRPTQVIWGIIPLFLFFKNNRDFWPSIKILLLYPLCSFLWNVPQLIYWKYFGGSWFMVNLHNESIVLSDPKILDFLFSFKKGWLLYTPVFLLIPLGLKDAFKTETRLAFSILLLTLASIYIFSSWECWWFAESFGSRVMQEIYPVLAILIGYFILLSRKNKICKYLISSILFIAVGLSILHSIQFKNGIIHSSRNTKDHYLAHFGVISNNGFDQSLLEMDRSDTSWLTNLLSWKSSLSNQKKYRILSKNIKLSNFNLSVEQNQDFIGHYTQNIFKLIPTDEARFEFSWDYENVEYSKNIFFVFVIENEYKDYNYLATEINLKNKLTFNLPNIRHKNDKFTIYLWNPNKGQGKFSNLQLTITYLERD